MQNTKRYESLSEKEKKGVQKSLREKDEEK